MCSRRWQISAPVTRCAAKGVLLRDGYQQQLTSTEQSYNDAVNSYKRLETLRGANPEVFKDGEGDFERARQDLNLAYRFC